MGFLKGSSSHIWTCKVAAIGLFYAYTLVGGHPIVRSDSLTNLTVNISTVNKTKLVEKNELEGSKRLSSELIKPPDHLGGVHMERDGHLNTEFRKEVILGSTSNLSQSQDEDTLKDVFIKADLDQNNLLSSKELENWIATKVKDHFQQAVKENYWIFSSLDKNHDGRVSWEEYHVNFMLEQGYDEKYAVKHAEDHKTLTRKTKEKILLDKAAWSEAANSDADALNIDEFLTFRHPEHSHVTLLNMVNDILSSLDTNGDEVLSEDEFANKVPEDSKELKGDWKQERIREFRKSIDINKDGTLSRQELLMYNDPENPELSKKAARELIRLADTDSDGSLSLEEILSKKDLFLGSKMVDTARSFHDEF